MNLITLPRLVAAGATVATILLGACGRTTAAPGPAPAARPPAAPAIPSVLTGELPLKHAPQPTTAAITPGDLMTRLYIYADDSMMGREVGTEYNLKATAYIEREVRRMGLRPAGDNGTFFQNIPLMTHTPAATGVITVDGTRFTVNTDFVPRDNHALDPAVDVRPIEGAQVVFGGVVGNATTMISPDQVTGKVVVITVPTVNGQAQWMGTRGPLTQLYINAAAVAVVALDDIGPAARAQYFLPEQIYSTRVEDSVPGFMYITRAMAEKLTGAPLAGLARGAAGRTVRGSVQFERKQAPGRNVVAILPGSDPVLRNQYLAIGAHNDHVGFNRAPLDHDSVRAFDTVVRPGGEDTPNRPATAQEAVRIGQMIDSMRRLHAPRRDSIFNGADDDGSGTTAVLEIAEALAASTTKPRRSIVFIWHTGEEKGLWGSDYFTEHPSVPRDSIVAQLNLDMVGRGGLQDMTGRGPGYLQLIGSRRLSTELGDIVESAGKAQPLPFRFDYSFDAPGHPQAYYCRSDHYNYARFGIPVAFFSTGEHRDYHELTDEPQYIDYQQLARVTTLVRDIAVSVGNLDHRPKVDKPKPNPYAPCVP